VILLCLLTFLAGAAYEAACVAWVHYSEKGRPVITALFSMMAALAEVSGVGGSVHDWRVAPFFVLGYGVGTYSAVEFKRRRSRSTP
jgi:hypothetical protein